MADEKNNRQRHSIALSAADIQALEKQDKNRIRDAVIQDVQEFTAIAHEWMRKVDDAQNEQIPEDPIAALKQAYQDNLRLSAIIDGQEDQLSIQKHKIAQRDYDNLRLSKAVWRHERAGDAVRWQLLATALVGLLMGAVGTVAAQAVLETIR